MQIDKHSVVSMHYTLTDHEGELFETTKGDEPITFLCGAEQILPAFEKELLGLRVGDVKQFVLAPEQGYGEYHEDLVQEWKRDQLKDLDSLEEGEVLEFEDDDGNVVEGEIVEIDGERVVIDFNHPLAGEELHYQIEITDIRSATAEEIAHGHVH